MTDRTGMTAGEWETVKAGGYVGARARCRRCDRKLYNGEHECPDCGPLPPVKDWRIAARRHAVWNARWVVFRNGVAIFLMLVGIVAIAAFVFFLKLDK